MSGVPPAGADGGQLRHVAAQMPHGDGQQVTQVPGLDIGERDWLAPTR
jgi:hypothetical protein